jgi:hypothetical protein
MPAHLNDVLDWIVRAEGARGVAECLIDPEAHRIMLGIADEYDRLVQQEIGRLAPARVKVGIS